MVILKSKENKQETEDQGYISAQTSPHITPSTSPQTSVSQTFTTENPQVNIPLYRLPVDVNLQRVDLNYFRTSRLLDNDASTNVAVKRGRDTNADIERKRYRLASQMSQVVLWLIFANSSLLITIFNFLISLLRIFFRILHFMLIYLKWREKNIKIRDFIRTFSNSYLK